MFKKNSIIKGSVLALIAPAASILAAYILRSNIFVINKPSLPYFAAIALNLILLRVFYKNGADKAAGGVMLVTFAFMIVIFAFKVHIGR